MERKKLNRRKIKKAERSARLLRSLIHYHKSVNKGRQSERDPYLDALRYALFAVEMRARGK